MRDEAALLSNNADVSRQLNHYKLDRTKFSVANLTDRSDEMEYWLSKTPQERWDAAEVLRQIAYGYDLATTKLQRVLEIIKHPWG